MVQNGVLLHLIRIETPLNEVHTNTTMCCDPKASTIPFSNSADVFDIFLISGVADFFSFSYILKRGSSLPVNTAMHLCLCWATMLGKQLVTSSANEAIPQSL